MDFYVQGVTDMHEYPPQAGQAAQYSYTSTAYDTSTTNQSGYDYSGSGYDTSSNQGHNYYGSQYDSSNGQGVYNIEPPAPSATGATTSGGSYSGGQYDSYSGGGNYGGHQNDYHDRGSYRGGLGGSRSSGAGFNKGSGSRVGGGGGGFRQNAEENDTVFISNLPLDTTEAQISAHFGSIGVIKNDKKTGKQKIWIYRKKDSGVSKGEATVTYDDPHTASAAINWFSGRDFNGHIIKVEFAQRRARNFGGSAGGSRDGPAGGGRAGGRGGRGGGRMDRGFGNDRMDRGGHRGGRGKIGDRGSRGGGPNPSGREGDWQCANPGCYNNNFAWRTECNRCQEPKPAGAGGTDGPMTPQVVDSRRGGGSIISPVDSRRGGPVGRDDRGRGGRGIGGGGFSGPRGGGSSRGGSRGGGGGGRGAPAMMRGGRGGGPMRGAHDRRSNPY